MVPLPGIALGHWHDAQAVTGCTVLLPLAGAMRAGVAVGAAPATRETDLLRPTATVQEVHALLLTGGSAFGLDAAAGVMAHLRERGIGFDAGVARVPIVPAAALFDLSIGSAATHPDAAAGRAACAAATSAEVREGTVGAGYGACVGRLLGPAGYTKGGLGLAGWALDGRVHVGALAVVNAVGDVIDEDGSILAGTRQGGRFVDSATLVQRGAGEGRPLTNTTLVAVATDARLDKTALTRLARLAHDGLARAISPAHMSYDGDTVFALSTGDVVASPDALGALAVSLVAAAIRRAVRTATGVAGVPAAAELPEPRPGE
jgi:L-aminopeptidase/D-esterase-like protein